ncbi:alpha/beta hydrolase family protein [Actinomadura hallensis]|uniref:Alpha/beta hydrolase family protein n=1 Tax=Actinomadura hallensis TaxID=337895 RepID=A0A543IMX2_9ACTN|nr:alpha/beta fold hydrolase [Actinomadura hallensis]TQM71933.1 alpha/beta hydrolase family protein [Actinomadura hallensis]
MFRNFRASAVVALASAAVVTGLTGCDEVTEAIESVSPSASPSGRNGGGLVSGTQKIEVGGKSVNVSCAGEANGRPTIVLLSGLGDGLEKMAPLQKTLSAQNRVCSYDRLGEGASDKPDGPQSLTDTGRILTGVLDRAAGDGPVVLAGHSLGGLIAARYAPDHTDRVKGLVLLDATSPTSVADVKAAIPKTASGQVAQLRSQTLSVHEGENPEMLVVPDGEVRSAGNIPVEVVQHGKKYLAAVPQVGPALERGWADGQRKWLSVSGDSRLSTAANSEHYIHVDEPDVAVQAVRRVTARAATA